MRGAIRLCVCTGFLNLISAPHPGPLLLWRGEGDGFHLVGVEFFQLPEFFSFSPLNGEEGRDEECDSIVCLHGFPEFDFYSSPRPSPRFARRGRWNSSCWCRVFSATRIL